MKLQNVVRELLLSNLIDVNKALPPLQLTPLHIAAQKGYAGIAFLLLSEGADVNAKTIAPPQPAQTHQPASPMSPPPAQPPAVPQRRMYSYHHFSQVNVASGVLGIPIGRPAVPAPQPPKAQPKPNVIEGGETPAQLAVKNGYEVRDMSILLV